MHHAEIPEDGPARFPGDNCRQPGRRLPRPVFIASLWRMQAVLVMFKPDGERRSFSLPRTITVIGRREDCDLRIPLAEVSRKHCRFIIDNDVLRLEDLGSSNGTYHNGERIQQAIINPGDTVQIGPIIFTVQIDGVPRDEDIQPVPAQALSGDTRVPSGTGASPTEAPQNEDAVIDLGTEGIEEVREDENNR